MTPEKLFNTNTRLAYKVLSKYRNAVSETLFEDLKQESLLGLWKAANSFDESKGFAFSTYAFRVINNQILMYLRGINKHKSNISLQSEIGEDIYLEDTSVAIKENNFEIENQIQLNDILRIMNESHSLKIQVFKELEFMGKKQREVATKFGIAQSYVCRLRKKAIKEIQSKLGIKE